MLLATGGILGPIAKVLGYIIEAVYNILCAVGIQNIGISIILFTLITKIILFPLSIGQQRNAKINQIMQPEISKIQKKYRNKRDQQSMIKQNKETQEVYAKYGFSPTGGCLPLLVQMPILFALYRVVMDIPSYIPNVYKAYLPVANAVMNEKGYVKSLTAVAKSVKLTSRYSLDAKPTVDQVVSYLSHMPNEAWDMIAKKLPGAADVVTANADKLIHMNDFFAGINITQAPGFKLSVCLIIPIIAAGSQFISTKISMATQPQVEGAESMNSMMMTMPLVSFFMCITLPVAIGIYWSASSLFQLIQQLILTAYYDHADMDKIIEKQREKYAKKKAKKGNKPSFMERMMDPSAAEAMQADGQKQTNSKVSKAASMNTKNLNNTNSGKKGGSIASKANIMKNFEDNQGGK